MAMSIAARALERPSAIAARLTGVDGVEKPAQGGFATDEVLRASDGSGLEGGGLDGQDSIVAAVVVVVVVVVDDARVPMRPSTPCTNSI